MGEFGRKSSSEVPDPQNSAFGCNFFVPKVPKRSKTLPNIIFALTEVIGFVWAKKLVDGSAPSK